MIKKLLIVDDSKVARKMLRKSLPRDKEYDIEEAVNGLDGVEKYSVFQPDIVFMDLTMPELDGFQATSEIRKINKDAIIIVMTADIQPRSVANITELGAFTVIRKPARAKLIEEAMTAAELKLKKANG